MTKPKIVINPECFFFPPKSNYERSPQNKLKNQSMDGWMFTQPSIHCTKCEHILHILFQCERNTKACWEQRRAIPALLWGRFRADSKDTFQGHDNGDVTVTQGRQAWHPRRD